MHPVSTVYICIQKYLNICWLIHMFPMISADIIEKMENNDTSVTFSQIIESDEAKSM